MKKRARKWVIILLLFFGANVALGWSEAVTVLETGMCPSAPTDIPPYPCTFSEYLERVFLGPFALPAQLVILGACIVVGSLVHYLIEVILKKRT